MAMRPSVCLVAGILCVMALGLGFSGADAGAPAAPLAGKAVAGVSLKLEKAGKGVVEVTVQNAGEKPIVVNLGMMLGNGRSLAPTQVTLLVTGREGKTLRFAQGPGVAGRVDDFLVPLMPGGKYSMAIPLAGFADEKGMRGIAAGDTIQAVYEGAEVSYQKESVIPGLPMWKGKVLSEAVKYEE